MAEVNEKVQNHAEEDFATLLEEYDAGKSRDEVVTGKVIALKDGEVFIDVGRKSEGILDAAEVSDEQGNPQVNGHAPGLIKKSPPGILSTFQTTGALKKAKKPER